MKTPVRSRVRRQVTPVQVAALGETIRGFEAEYGYPSERMPEVSAFRDEEGQLIESDELIAWGSAYARYQRLATGR
jgi:ribosomal protein S12 methylthiotransferase accessory factor YcaO